MERNDIMNPRRLLIALTIVALSVAGTEIADACGEKFLVAAADAYAGGATTVTPARILVLWNSEEDGEEDGRLQLALEEAGHTLEVVADAKSLYGSAASGDFDLIMMELDDARIERERLRGVSPSTPLLPFVAFPTRREYSEAKKEFGIVLKTPTRLSSLLRTVEKSCSRGEK
jgi:hypothetical protein